MSFRRVQHHPQAPVLGLVQKIGPQLKFKTRMTEEELGNLVFDDQNRQFKIGDVIFWESDDLNGLGLVYLIDLIEDNSVRFYWVPFGGDNWSADVNDQLLRRVSNVSANDVVNQFGDWFWKKDCEPELKKKMSLFKK